MKARVSTRFASCCGINRQLAARGAHRRPCETRRYKQQFEVGDLLSFVLTGEHEARQEYVVAVREVRSMGDGSKIEFEYALHKNRGTPWRPESWHSIDVLTEWKARVVEPAELRSERVDKQVAEIEASIEKLKTLRAKTPA